MKKTISVLLCALLMLLCAVPAIALETDETATYTQDGIIYTLNLEYGTGCASGSEEGLSGTVIIPAYIEYQGVRFAVNRIGVRAFADQTAITDVIVEEGIKFVDGYAFAYCFALTDVYFPAGILTCDITIFDGCGGDVTLHAYSGAAISALEAASNITVEYLDEPTTPQNFFQKLIAAIKAFFSRILAMINLPLATA